MIVLKIIIIIIIIMIVLKIIIIIAIIIIIPKSFRNSKYVVWHGPKLCENVFIRVLRMGFTPIPVYLRIGFLVSPIITFLGNEMSI